MTWLGRDWRWWAAMAATLTLAGCANMVASPKPVFGPRDLAGAPALKPGLWAPQIACGDNPSLECKAVNASRLEITPTDVGLWPDPAHPAALAPAPFELPVLYAVASGDPPVVQLRLIPAKAAPAGAKLIYLYFALNPTARDPDGRVIAAELWAVNCGPPPAPGEPGYQALDDEGDITPHPLAGLKMDGGNCVPNGLGAVRHAAAPSRAWAGDPFRMHWVADGPPAPASATPQSGPAPHPPDAG